MIIALSIFIYGCGECKVDSDCKAKNCYDITCIDKKCVENIVQPCCGNGICDSTESKCSCEDDCGKCFGVVGSYMEMICENDKCFAGVKTETINQKAFSNDLSFPGFTVAMKTTLDEPFNIDESIAKINFKLKQRQSEVIDPKIAKIEVKGIVSGQSLILGEKEIGRILWEGQEVNVEIPLTLSIAKYEEKASITFIIYYEYTQKIKSADDIKRSGSFTQALNYDLVFVDSGKERTCPNSCDDNNECTIDICDEITKNFCEHRIKPNCKGNYICEEGEDKCTAPLDCGSCEGDVSESVYLKCVDNVCNSLIKTGLQQPITLSEKATPVGYFKWNMETTYDQPFDVSSSSFKLEIRLESVLEGLSLPIKLNEIRIKEGALLLGKKSTSSSLSSVGSTITEIIPLSFRMDEYEEKKNINIEIDYDYTANSQEFKANTFTKAYTNVNFVKTGALNE